MSQKKKAVTIADAAPATRLLFKALREGNLAEIRKFLRGKDKIPVNVRDPDDPLQATPLLVAAEMQNYEVVKILLKARPTPADVNAENRRGVRPIWFAAKYGDKTLADLLLNETKQKCDVNYVDKQSGCTPLYRSILSNCSEVCRELLHAGADVNLRRLGLTGDAATAETPVIKTVHLDNAETCEMLLNSMCDINARSQDGFTALHYAVAYRRYNIAEILLHNRIKLHAKSNRGVTAMTLAIDHQTPAMCKLLIEFGYDMNRSFEWGETPLEMAIRTHSEGCALTLVYWGCKIIRDRNERTNKQSYFFLAACEGLVQLMKMMLRINPFFLNERWLKKKHLPLALYKRPEFYEWLFEASSNPCSLADLCKAKIRHYLGKYPCSKIDKLPLPKKLLRSMKFKDLLPEKVYRPITIYTDECPYDCPSVCVKQQCPPLDFSDSGSDFSLDGDI